jgi:hypothetical protein
VKPGRWIACAFPIIVTVATTPPSNASRIRRRAWLLFPLVAFVFLVATTSIRLRRVEFVSEVAGAPAATTGDMATTRPTAWRPHLVVPGHHNESYEWLDLTREMFAQRVLRVRHVDYENAPSGREVYASSPYRWWLGFVALAYHGVTRAHQGPSLEWAALYADPLLLMVFGAATVAFVAWRFGFLAAGLTSAALVTLFPFAAEFLPGVPDDLGLAGTLAVWSLLPLLAGAALLDLRDAGRSTRAWYFIGGIAGGVGLWINVFQELPILLGIGLGALLAAWIGRAARGATPGVVMPVLPWRAWGLAGAGTCLAAYLIEYFPSHLGSWELRAIHPIYGVAWLGGSEVLARLTSWIGGEKPKWTVRAGAASVLGAVALCSLPAAMWILRKHGILAIDLQSMRLSLLPDGPSAPTLWAWLLQNGFTASAWATMLPLLVVVPSVLLLLPRTFSASLRVPIALALGPVVAATALTYRQIGWWNGVDASLIVLLIASAPALRAAPRPAVVGAIFAVFVAGLLVPGAIQVWPSSNGRVGNGLSEGEVIGLVERDMAYWLAGRDASSGGVILAPPNQTTTCYYFGGLRGLSTFGWENREGFQTAIRIMSATTPEEAQELIGAHGVTQIIIPSWDSLMDAYAQIGAGQISGTFLERLNQWNLPRWLRPVPYLVPSIGGFEGQSAVVLEVVEEQDDATALSRIAEYFASTEQLNLASKAAAGLRRFPADLGALVARSEVEAAAGDSDEFGKSIDLIVRRIASGADRDLQWDQRVALAVVLVQAHRADIARPRFQQCLAEIDEEKLRSLSTILLYRLQVLRKALNLEISDPALRALSLELLPSDLRARAE